LATLTLGDFSGWLGYEARWQVGALAWQRRSFTAPSSTSGSVTALTAADPEMAIPKIGIAKKKFAVHEFRGPHSFQIKELAMDGRFVIVRAFGGEPLRRVVVNIGERLIYIANPDLLERVNSGESSAVGFPPDDVFDFDDKAFSALRSEWNEKGHTKLWSSLRRFRREEAAN
jgi:hypothetical protein